MGRIVAGCGSAVVICDEAGLKSNRQGAELLRLAQKHDMRVLLVGDVRQHVSVEAGDFLRVLEAHSQLGRCQVGEIHRQIPAEYRLAITQMAMGDVRGGLEKLDHLNGIREGQSNYLEHAAADYLRLTDQGRKFGSLPGRVVHLGGEPSIYRLDPQWPERTRRASGRGNVSYGQRIAPLDESAKARLAPV